MRDAYAESLNVININSISSDSNINSKANEEYQKVQKIVVCNIEVPSTYKYESDEVWYKDLYYYLVGIKGFDTIPYNFIVGKKSILGYSEIESKKIDNQPLVRNRNGIVLIGVYDLDALTEKQKDLLKSLITKLLDVYDLHILSLFKGSCSMQVSDKVLLQVVINDDNMSDLLGIQDTDIPNEYDRNYSLQIEDVCYQREVKDITDGTTVKMEIRNNGIYPIYPSDQLYIGLDHDNSIFYSNSWLSFDIVQSITENLEKPLLPGESTNVEFTCNTPLISGKYEETFVLISNINDKKNVLDDTKFTMRVNVTNAKYDIAEIKSTETGFLNVRKQPSINADIITRVKPGDKYIMLEQQTYWIKIRIDDEREGWVYSKYVKITKANTE